MRLIGIGSGLFLLCFLWTITIIVLILTTRAKPPYTSLGPLVLLISTLISTLLLLIPRSPFAEREISSNSETITRKPLEPEDVTDWMHFWRVLIILINLITLIIGSVIIYSRWITKRMTRFRPPSVDFLQINQLVVVHGERGQDRGGNDVGEEGGDGGTSKGGKNKKKMKNDQKKKKTRKKSENKEETGTGDGEQEE